MSLHLLKLIEQGEGQMLDFKFEISDQKRIGRTLAAFANTDGGKLLVGVKDNGKIAGVRSDEEYYMLEGASSLYTKPEVKLHISPWTLERKTVLEVDIEKSLQLHKALSDDGKWLVYVRVGDKTLPANSVYMNVWKKRQEEKPVLVRYSKSEKILLDYLEINENISLSKFCRIAHITRHMAEEILTNLIVLDIIDLHLAESNSFYSLK